MDQPLDLHTAAIINLGDQFAHVTRQLAHHRRDYIRAAELASHIKRNTKLRAFAAPPTLPLGGNYAPTIVVDNFWLAIPFIEQTGHIVINNGGTYQINPPDGSPDNALTFKLEQTP